MPKKTNKKKNVQEPSPAILENRKKVSLLRTLINDTLMNDKETIQALQEKLNALNTLENLRKSSLGDTPMVLEFKGNDFKRIADALESQAKTQKEMWDMIKNLMTLGTGLFLAEMERRGSPEEKEIIEKMKPEIEELKKQMETQITKEGV